MGGQKRVRRLKRRLAHLEILFPNLAPIGYVPKSDPVPEYNCIAWAAEDTTRVWQGSNADGYWPEGATEGYAIEALVSAFVVLGYSDCGKNGRVERGYDKVALYSTEFGKWTHAARQLPDGRWTSKTGGYEDIIHRTPFALIGKEYGKVWGFMKRARSAPRPAAPPPIAKRPPSRKEARQARRERKRST